MALADDARRGLLGKGAILMVTSHAHRTSPVLRGKWVLENVLGAPPPRTAGRGAAVRGETEAAQAAIGARADGATPAQPGLRRAATA